MLRVWINYNPHCGQSRTYDQKERSEIWMLLGLDPMHPLTRKCKKMHRLQAADKSQTLGHIHHTHISTPPLPKFPWKFRNWKNLASSQSSSEKLRFKWRSRSVPGTWQNTLITFPQHPRKSWTVRESTSPMAFFHQDSSGGKLKLKVFSVEFFSAFSLTAMQIWTTCFLTSSVQIPPQTEAHHNFPTSLIAACC